MDTSRKCKCLYFVSVDKTELLSSIKFQLIGPVIWRLSSFQITYDLSRCRNLQTGRLKIMSGAKQNILKLRARYGKNFKNSQNLQFRYLIPVFLGILSIFNCSFLWVVKSSIHRGSFFSLQKTCLVECLARANRRGSVKSFIQNTFALDRVLSKYSLDGQ